MTTNRKERAFTLLGMLLLWAAIFSILPGCATMIDEHRRIADWPDLEIRDNVVSFGEVIRRCGKYTSIVTWPPLACAEVHFDTKVCNIWRMADADAWILEHERAHCGGMDHPNDNALAKAWESYKVYAAGAAVARGIAK